MCNRVESEVHANALPARARLLVVDPKYMDESNRALTRWYKQQRQEVLFTASMDAPWVREVFPRPGVYVGHGRAWQGAGD